MAEMTLPQIKVTTEDVPIEFNGEVIYFPAGTSDEEITNVLDLEQQKLDQEKSNIPAPAPLKTGEYSPLKEGFRSAGQGLTFGFADELEALIRTGSINSDEYKAVRDEIRGKQQQFGEEFPVTATLAEIIPSLALPFGLVKTIGSKLGMGAVQKGLQSSSLGSRVGTGAGVGGGAGAITGVGTAEEMSDIPENVAIQGTIGAIGAPVLGEALRFGGTALRTLGQKFGLGDANKSATKTLADILAKDEIDPADIPKLLAEYKKLGVSSATIADLGDNLKQLGFVVQATPGVGKKQTKEFLEERGRNIPDEITTGLINKSKVESDVFGYNYVKKLTQRQKEQAEKLYPEAYNKSLLAKDFKPFLDRDIFKEAYEKAVKRADVYGEKLPTLEQIKSSDYIPTNVLHQVKIGLDRVVEGETDKVTGKITALGNDVQTVRKQFNDLIKKNNPDYKKANAKFADESKIRDAHSLGEQAGNKKLTTDELLDKLGKMNLDEKESFRVGLISQIKEKLSNFKGGDFERSVFGSDKQRQALRQAFPDSESYSAFVKQLELQRGLKDTQQQILGGSQTKARDIATSEVADVADIATGGKTGLLRVLTRMIKSNVLGDKQGDILRKQLLSPDPKVQNEAIQSLLNLQNQASQGLLGGGSSLIPAQSAGTSSGLLMD